MAITVNNDDNQAKPDILGIIAASRKTNPAFAKKLLKKYKKKRAKTRQTIKPALKWEQREINNNEDVEVEYVATHDLPDDVSDEIRAAFERFEQMGNERISENHAEEETPEIDMDDDRESDSEEKPGEYSKKKLLKLQRPTLMHLKQLATRPDVVEIWDTTAPDPDFLVFLKSMRNTVSMPIHWSSKRRYLAGKKGFEKRPFTLPSYVEATKIQEIRRAIIERDADKTLKQKQRERMRPKSHRMDIDYQVLHDAFFKYSTKPVLTRFGDLYYEGKEQEQLYDKFKPGQLSDELRAALGMGDGMAPPWLINMQRYGPPAAYPTLRIPGLNAPIPMGAQYGYQNGGWGQPPVDQMGNPLYGNFDLEARDAAGADEPLWGELADDYDEEEEPEPEKVDNRPKSQTDKPDYTSASTTDRGTETPADSGTISVVSTTGIDTPASVELVQGTQKAYQVLRQTSVRDKSTLFGPGKAYRIPGHPIPGGIATPTSAGITTPHQGLLTPLGIATPQTGFSSIPPRMAFGLLPITEPEFSPDAIRQQLKEQADQAQRAKQAAKQVEIEAKRSDDKQKKKKKEFKF